MLGFGFSLTGSGSGGAGSGGVTTIDLRNQGLTGTYTLHDNAVVERVRLTGNQFTGLDIVNCPALDELELDDQIPLETIKINGTAISGQFKLGVLSPINPAALTSVDVSGNQITELHVDGQNGPIAEVVADDNPLTVLTLQDCPQLPTVSIDGVTTLTEVWLTDSEAFEGMDLSANTGLLTLTLQHFPEWETIDLTPFVNLQELAVQETGITDWDVSPLVALQNLNFGGPGQPGPPITTIDVSDNHALIGLRCRSIATLTSVTLPATENNNIQFVFIDDCNLPQSEVNEVLVAADATGIEDGFIDMTGASMAAPSGAGLTAKTSLEGKGWNVAVN